MGAVENIITDNLPIWSSAIQSKSSAGRGTSSKRNLYGVKKLRELVLDLAVRGLLVSQDPNNEPASVLLEKITAEKERLVKEGKIKKQKTLPLMTASEKLFSLPSNWSWTRAQDISTYIQRGKSPKYDENGQVTVISQKCVQWSGLDFKPARSIDNSSLDAYKLERFLCAEDLLWNSTGTGTVGRIAVVSEVPLRSMVADSHVTVLRITKANKNYIKTYISSTYVQKRIDPEHENSLVSGSTKQVELNTSSIINLPVPIPPLAEQHRIVAKVDELMALCDTLEQQQEDSIQAHEALVEVLLEALSSAVDADTFHAAWGRISEHFDALFTTDHSINKLKETILQLAVMGKLVPQDPSDEPASILLEKIAAEKEKLSEEGKLKKQKLLPIMTESEKLFSLPRNWSWTRAQDISTYIQRGKSPKYDEKGQVTVISQKCVQWIGLDLKPARTIANNSLVAYQPERFLCDDDLLWNSTGTGTVGRIAVVSEVPLRTMVADSHVTVLRINKANKDYIKTYISSAFVQKRINPEHENSLVSGSTKQVELNTSSIINLPVPIPPLAEQHRIVTKVDELMAICDQLKSSLQQAQETQILLTDAVVENAL